MFKRSKLDLGAGAGPGGGARPLKRARLDVTISDHNFPLSQSGARVPDAQPPADEWGDVKDEEILLLASQACEEATDRDITALPDYSTWIRAPSASTQRLDSSMGNQKDIYGPSTSKNTKQFALKVSTTEQDNVKTNSLGLKHINIPRTSKSIQNYQNSQLKRVTNSNFEFKKPSSNVGTGASSTDDLSDSNNFKASPLTNVAGNIIRDNPEEEMALIHTERETEYFYKKALLLQEENAKLKSENGNLHEKCLTRDGEVSIVRAQLKASQVALDNARLDRLRANEKMKMEWTEKLDNASKDARNLKTELEFKNLEVVSMKDRCRNLESNKVKMTQVTPGSQIGQRQTKNNTFSIEDEFERKYTVPAKKCTVANANVQTDNKHNFMKLNPSHRSDKRTLARILPLLLEPERVQRSSLELDHRLQLATQSKCSTLYSVHRKEIGEALDGAGKRERLSVSCLYEDLAYLAALADGRFTEEGPKRKCLDIATRVKSFLEEVLGQLKSISQKVTAGFQRDMDEIYMQESAVYRAVERDQLHSAAVLFKDEQAIPARRAAATLATLCTSSDALRECIVGVEMQELAGNNGDTGLVNLMRKIAHYIADASCAIQYSGLLLSFICLIQSLLYKCNHEIIYNQLSSLVKEIIVARPSLAVVCSAWSVLRRLSLNAAGLEHFCNGNSGGNLQVDREQGLMLYKKESCFLQVLLKQLEVALKCIEREGQAVSAVTVARDFVSFYRNADAAGQPWCQLNANAKCNCSLLLAQVMVYLLRICAAMLKKTFIQLPKGDSTREELLAICRCGLAILHLRILDSEFITLLSFYEGHYHLFIELCEQMKEDVTLDEIQGYTLRELVETLQLIMDDVEPASSPLVDLWEDSFCRFTLAD